MQRPLSQMLTELATSFAAPPGMPMTVSSASLDLPIEVALRWGADGAIDFLADVPGWRWETAFDQKPGRLRMNFEHAGDTR